MFKHSLFFSSIILINLYGCQVGQGSTTRQTSSADDKTYHTQSLSNKSDINDSTIKPITFASRILINEEMFKQNGGNPNNISQSLERVNNLLREQSYRDPFFSVGKLPGCTGTWLGEYGRYSYILTAAHCVSYTAEQTPINSEFKAWNGEIIAKGNGIAYIPRSRVSIAKDTANAINDIAILELPRLKTPVNKYNQPIAQPILYSGNNEVSKTVDFVGYGKWGVGSTIANNYLPQNSDRRLWAQNVIKSISGQGQALHVEYQPYGNTDKWGSTAPGDSGSAWWQNHNGTMVIVAVHSNAGNNNIYGLRVSKNIQWIINTFPNARVY